MMPTHEQQTRPDPERDDLAALEALAEHEAAEADARAAAAATARERLDAARKAHSQQQLEPLRQRQRDLAVALGVIDAQAQAIIVSTLAEALGLYREAGALYCERQTVANAALALGAAGSGEPVPTFGRFVMAALATFRDRNGTTWMEVPE